MKKKYQLPLQKPNDDFNDDRLQKPQLKLPKIDKDKASNTHIDKITTSSQSINEAPLPKVVKQQRLTTSSNAIQFPQVRLPKIDAHQTLSNREHPKEEQLQLRRQTEFDESIPRENDQDYFDPQPSAEANQAEIIDRDEFVKEVEQKLRVISDNRAQAEVIEDNDKVEAESDLSDFQQKVLQNRQIIKKQVFKKKSSLAKKGDQPKKPGPKKRNESLYERRAREYRDNAENKYLREKKKEVAAREQRDKLRQQRGASPKQLRERRKTPLRYRTDKYIPESAKVIPVAPSKELLRPAKQQNQDANARLFQNIHTILQNPHKSRSEFLSLGKAKTLRTPLKQQLNELSEKLKKLDLQDSNQQSLQHMNSSSISLDVVPIKRLGEHNLLDWRRISISPVRAVQMAESNFGNQMDRIGEFITKNEQSIGSYIRNRQLLMEIQLHNKLRDLGQLKVSPEEFIKRSSDVQSI